MRISHFIHMGAVLNFVMFHAGCFGKYLDPNYHALIGAFKEKYLKLQEYSEDFLEGVKLGLPWKIHILCVHLPEWLDEHTEGLSKYAEQTCEATHKDFSATYNRFKRKESDHNHGRSLLRSVVEYSSRRIGNRVTINE